MAAWSQIITPTLRWGKKTRQHANIKENKTDVCPILQLNGVGSQIVRSPYHPISRFATHSV